MPPMCGSDGQDPSGDFVRLSVSDTGVGMSPEVLTARSSRSLHEGDRQGSAWAWRDICLPPSPAAALRSTARLGVERASLLLPRSHKTPPPKPNRRPCRAPLGSPARRLPGHVLLVEDDNEVAALAIEMLNSVGFEVMRVAGATAALGAPRERPALRHRFFRHHDAGRHERTRTRARSPTASAGLPIVLTTGYAGAPPALRRGFRAALEAVQPGSAGAGAACTARATGLYRPASGPHALAAACSGALAHLVKPAGLERDRTSPPGMRRYGRRLFRTYRSVLYNTAH